MAQVPLCVIIPTFNEQSNLEATLASVRGWAAEVFVVDSYSTDRTVDIALASAQHGVGVVQHEFKNYADQWNWALENLPIRSPWTMKLDADERVPAALKQEITELLSSAPGDVAGVYLRRRMFFMGSPLDWGGISTNAHLRIWRTGAAHFERRSVNEHALVSGRTVHAAAALEHHDYKSLTHWLDRHNRYSSLEASALIEGNVIGDVRPCFWGDPDQRRMWLRRMYYKIPMRQLAYFLYRFVGQLGFLDGRAGFRYALLHANFLYWIDLKRQEAKVTGCVPDILWPPRGCPHPVVAVSDLQRSVSTPPNRQAA